MNETMLSVQTESAEDHSSAPDAGATDLRFLLARQRDRALAISAAGLATVVARLAGLVSFDLALGMAVLAFGWASVLGFKVFYLQRARHGRVLSRRPWWLVADVLFVSALFAISGGMASPWVAGYVACVGGAAAVLVAGAARLRDSRRLVSRQGEEIRRQGAELRRTTSDLEATTDLLRDLRLADSLTGARNRRYFRELSSAAIERRAKFDGSERRSRRSWDGMGVLLVDIDGFKHINEGYGHPAGDRVLSHVGHTLRRCLRPDDTLVRWGNDEFLVLLAGTDPGHTGEVAERMVQALSGDLCEIRPRECLALSCSAGWSHLDWQGGCREPLEAAVAAAHAALYRAKREQPGGAIASHCGEDAPAAVSMIA